MLNRRELLKYFGAGSVVVPIIGSTPTVEAAGRLVTPANVLPVELTKIVKPFSPSQVVWGEFVLHLDNGETRTAPAWLFVVPGDHIEIRAEISDGYRSPAPTKANLWFDGQLT